MESKASSLCLCFFFFSCLIISSQAYDFLVGGRDGWVVRPSESYDSWAQRMRFQVNDTLVFRYQNGTDSVLAVNRQDYDTCNTSSPILRMEGGNSRYMLERSGPFYFITGSQPNCLAGQKLILIVMSPRSPPTPIPTPVTPPGSAPSPQVQPPSGSVAPTPSAGQAPTPGAGQAPTPSGSQAPTPSGGLAPPPSGGAPTPGGGGGGGSGPSGSEGPSGGGGGSDGGGGAGDEVPTPNTPPSASPALVSSMGLSVLVILVWGSLVGTF